MGLPLRTEKIANKIWTTVTWAVYDGDVPIVLALRSILGGERLHGGEVDPLGVWRGTLTISRDGSTKLGQQRGSVGHTDGEDGLAREGTGYNS